MDHEEYEWFGASVGVWGPRARGEIRRALATLAIPSVFLFLRLFAFAEFLVKCLQALELVVVHLVQS